MALIKNIRSGSLNEIDILGNLDVSGSLRVSGVAQASSANVLTYDTASGQIYYTASSAVGGGGGTAAGSNTQIQYNSGGTFGATGSFRFIYASQSLQQGHDVQALGQYSHAEGFETQAIGEYSHAEGYLTQAIGEASHAEGRETQAIGQYSHAEGNSTQAIGEYSHAEGAGTRAIGNFSHAEGNQTKTGTQNAYSASVANGIVTMSAAYPDVSSQFVANNRLYLYDAPFDGNYGRAIFIISQSYYNDPNTIVELYDTNVNTTKAYVGDINYGILNWTGDQTIPGDYSHAEGSSTQAIGQYSHAEGVSAQAIGDGSHAEGYDTQALRIYSHAEGSNTQAIGYASHAEGESNIASGNWSHAEGDGSQAIGIGSHAEGNYTIASGSYSHAEGVRTVTSASFQHAQGIANIGSAVTGAFIVGNGTLDQFGDVLTRSNLIHAAGNIVEITGSLDVSGSGRFTNGLTVTGSTNLTGSLTLNGIERFSHYIGEQYGGGVIFHLWTDNTGEHGLIVDTTELSVAQSWSNVVSTAIGSSARSSWDGLNNSSAIIAQATHTNSAAKLCLDSTNGGQNDWYLPSVDEFVLLWNNRFNVNKTLSSIGGATPILYDLYWSSTEVGSTDAWAHTFGSGYTFDLQPKGSTLSVRAIRAF
jgi:hypothetical protein